MKRQYIIIGGVALVLMIVMVVVYFFMKDDGASGGSKLPPFLENLGKKSDEDRIVPETKQEAKQNRMSCQQTCKGLCRNRPKVSSEKKKGFPGFKIVNPRKQCKGDCTNDCMVGKEIDTLYGYTGQFIKDYLSYE